MRRSRSGVVVVVADVDRVPEQRDRVADLLYAEAKFPSNYYYGVQLIKVLNYQEYGKLISVFMSSGNRGIRC